MIVEPRYSGCRVNRYGPLIVTSRPLPRCPAAQRRTPSPAAATATPAASDALVGRASHAAMIPQAKPSVTRRRAIHCTASVTRSPGEPLLNCCAHFRDADVLQTPARPVAHAVVVTLAAVESRDAHVVGGPRAVAVRIRWPEDADGRGTDRCTDVQRPRVAGDHERGGPGYRDEIGYAC